MAREQGDELGTETTYTHPDHDGERRAYSAADRVNLEARGWVAKTRGGAKAPKDKGGAKAVASNGEGGHA